MPHLVDLRAAAGVLSPILRRFNLRFDERRCAETAEALIHFYPSLDAEDRRLVRKGLELAGMAKVVEALTGSRSAVDTEEGYNCPVLRTMVVSPCEARQCRYHLKGRPESLNCILVHSDEAELRADAVADVLGLREDQVVDLHLSALRKMRATSVEVAMEQAGIRRQFVAFSNPSICAACEGPIEGTPYYAESGVYLCSLDCCAERPPEHLILETRFGVPIARLVAWIRHHYETADAAAQALGFPPAVINAAIKSFSGSSYVL